MIARTVKVFHRIAAVRITIFARARAVTLESVNLIVQVHRNKYSISVLATVSIEIFLIISEYIQCKGDCHAIWLTETRMKELVSNLA